MINIYTHKQMAAAIYAEQDGSWYLLHPTSQTAWARRRQVNLLPVVIERLLEPAPILSRGAWRHLSDLPIETTV